MVFSLKLYKDEEVLENEMALQIYNLDVSEEKDFSVEAIVGKLYLKIEDYFYQVK